jgi:sugar phosphate permease
MIEEVHQLERVYKGKYLTVLLLCFSAFGNHFSRHALSVFGMYLIEEQKMTSLGLGALFSAMSLPSMFLPLLVGYLVDYTNSILFMGGVLLTITVAAECLFTYSLYLNSFTLTLISQFLFGCGSTSFSTIQRTMVSYYLQVGLIDPVMFHLTALLPFLSGRKWFQYGSYCFHS